MLITRDIINPDISFHHKNKTEICLLINRWKRLLVNEYQAQRGQTLALGIFTVNHNHLALIFAASELGMKLFLITKAISWETIPATKLGIHGPVDIIVAQEFEPNDHHPIMFQKYSTHVIPESAIDTYTDDADFQPWQIDESDVLIFASTSGTTEKSKAVMFSHKDVYEISKRNISVFKLYKTSVVQHLTNMHHASSMLTSLMPSLMVCDTHYYGNIGLFADTNVKVYSEVKSPKDFINEIISLGVDRLQLSEIAIDLFLLGWHEVNPISSKRILLNVSGYTLPKYYYGISKRLPINFISHYGSIDTGIPLLINYVDSEASYEPDYLGKIPDNFYIISNDKIACNLWSTPRNMPDDLRRADGKFYYQGRIKQNSISEEMLQLIDDQIEDYSIVNVDEDVFLITWDKKYDFSTKSGIRIIFKDLVFLEKDKFIIDTKISMEQLREYLRHNYAKDSTTKKPNLQAVEEQKNKLVKILRDIKNDYTRYSQ